ncbi:hypothetical protein [Tateyamaria sp.]|uniref:hypothetical protein n=1 Tax=Tateyamaria sp. TaxID=1929288 RepID=UPI003B216DED
MEFWGDILDRGWNTLDSQLDARNARRLQEVRDRPALFEAATDREDKARDDNRALTGLKLDDKRARYRLATDREDLARDDRRALTGLKLDDRRARFDQSSARATGERADARALLGARADVYRDAFESRRGDTLIGRLMWPLAVTAGIGGGIWLLMEWGRK